MIKRKTFIIQPPIAYTQDELNNTIEFVISTFLKNNKINPVDVITVNENMKGDDKIIITIYYIKDNN